MQHCPNWGAGELKIIAAILDRSVIEKILIHLGRDPQPSPWHERRVSNGCADTGRNARSSAVVPPRRADGPCAGRTADYQQAPRRPKAGLGSLPPRQFMDARRAASDVNGLSTCWSCRCWRPWGVQSGCSQDRGHEVRSHEAAELMRCRHRVCHRRKISTR